MSRSVAIMQMSGGVGATTLALNLVHIDVWPRSDRILLSMSPTDSGDLFFRFGFRQNTKSDAYSYLDYSDLHGPPGIISLGWDVGNADRTLPRALSSLSSSEWILPIVPQPRFSDAISVSDHAWWNVLLDKASQSDLDVIIDAGRALPDGFGVTRQVIEFADVVYLLVRDHWELAKAKETVVRFSQKIIPILVGEEMFSFGAEVGDYDLARPLQMEWNKKTARLLRSNFLAIRHSSKAIKPYVALLAEITDQSNDANG